MHIIQVFYILFALVSIVNSTTLDFNLIGYAEEQCHFNEKICVAKWNCKSEPTPRKYIINLRSNANCNYLEKCCDLNNYKVISFTASQRKNVCGHTNPLGVLMSLEDDIHNFANFGEYPWIIAIFNEASDYICTGTLLHYKVVLTTNSCTGSNFTVRAGEWDLKTDKEILPHQDIPVDLIIYHDKVMESPEQNDIALLILKKPFDAHSHIGPACLPTPSKKLAKSNCLVLGWNKFSSRHTAILERNYMNTQPESTNDPNSNLFSADSQRDGVLHAFGSALVCPWSNNPNRYSITGLWISGRGDINTPTHFINVSKFEQWIRKKLENYRIYL